MSRNFYVSRRAISGGNQQSPGSHMRDAILPRNSISNVYELAGASSRASPSRSLGMRGKKDQALNLFPSQSILHSEDVSDADREVAATFFAFASFAAPMVLFGFGLIFYVLFIA